jgi:hypothetical protein
MEMNLKLLFFLPTLFLFASCEKEETWCEDSTNPACPNFDPCFLLSPAVSAFDIIDSTYVGGVDSAVARVVDTILTNGTGYFRATHRENIERFEWKIGYDSRVFEGPDQQLDFYDYVGDVTVRLITYAKDGDGTCLQAEELTDTSFQTFTVAKLPDGGNPILGTFTGYNLSNPDSLFSVEVFGFGEPFIAYHFISGLPVTCESGPPGIFIRPKYRFFVSSTSTHGYDCHNALVYGEVLDDHKTLHLYYAYDDEAGNRIRERFVGVKD